MLLVHVIGSLYLHLNECKYVRQGVLIPHCWLACAKACIHLCTRPIHGSVVCLWSYYGFEECFWFCFSPVAQTFGCLFQLPFFFFLISPWWLWRSCTKGEEMLTKLFIPSKVIWKSLFLLSNCINEKEAQRKRPWLEAEEKHQPDCRRGEVTKIFISTRLENNIC